MRGYDVRPREVHGERSITVRNESIRQILQSTEEHFKASLRTSRHNYW